MALPELNIGMVGHVDHGKTTLVKALSGKWADTHSEEIKRGITIRLGYADIAFYKAKGVKGAEAYGVLPERADGKETEQVLRASIVDAPGHESLMATMLCGANLMDLALLLVAANEKCPQAQTQEHLQALEIMGVKDVIIIQNKIDLVTDEQANNNYEEIKQMIKGTAFEDAPIIPMSALHGINLDVLVQTICENFKPAKTDKKKSPIMFVARSFDINKPGIPPSKITGGVLGGVLKQGELKVGDEIEILPGYQVEEKNMKVWKKISSKIDSIIAGGKTLKSITPGGTFAIKTRLDPNVVKSDKLVGSVVGRPGELPPLWQELELKIHLLERMVGAQDQLVIEPLKPKEILMLNVNSAATVGVVQEFRKGVAKLSLKRPVCAEEGSRVTLSRRLGQRWRLIGYGEIQ